MLAQDSFLLIISSDERDPQPTLVNINPNGVLLRLTGNNELTVTGKASEELIVTLMRRSIMANGQAVPESAIPWR